MGKCKVWVLQSCAYNESLAFECEFSGAIDECFDYIKFSEPRYGWVISDSAGNFICSGEKTISWEKFTDKASRVQ